MYKGSEFFVPYGHAYANNVVFVSNKMYLIRCFFLRVPLAHHFGLLYIMSKAKNEEESESNQGNFKVGWREDSFSTGSERGAEL